MVLPPEKQPSEGRLSYTDGDDFIFIDLPGRGMTMFAEIRGFGAGLPQDANAQEIVRLWNEENDRQQPCATCGDGYYNHSRHGHCPGQHVYTFTTLEESKGEPMLEPDEFAGGM